MIRSLSGRPTACNFHSYVISEIGYGIASGRFAIGSVLPGDADMTDTYGVSRTVLREALKTIEAKGMVEARAKVGTRVLPRSRWNLFDRQVLTWVHHAGPDEPFLSAFLELRSTVELQAASLAATRRTAEQLRMLHYWLNQRALTAHAVEPHALAEFEIHRLLCEASQNPFLRTASVLAEFAVVRSVVPRMGDPVGDLAAEKSPAYDALVRSTANGQPIEAARAMADVLAIDHRWILASAGQGR